MLISVLKYNPYHGKDGRFASRAGAASISPRKGRGVDFVSPNKGNISYGKAKERLGSREQSLLTAYSGKINSALGIKGSTANVVGAWADGAENSTVGIYGDDVSYEAIRAAAALKGLLEKQKAVIAFKARPGGKARITEVELLGDMDQHHAQMLDAGIEFHTLQSTAQGTKAWVFQDESSSDLNGLLSSYSKTHDGKLKTWAGDGEFIGSWDSRSDGAKAYRAELNSYTKKHPKTKKAIGRVMQDWKRRAGQ
jgi:hypothetical protein